MVMSSSQLVSKGLSVEGAREGSTTKFHAARDLLVEGENKLTLRVEDEFLMMKFMNIRSMQFWSQHLG